MTYLGEVPLPELVLLNLESSLEDLLGLGSSDGDVAGDLLVPSDSEVSNGVSSLGGDGRLSSELLEHLGRSGEPVSRLSDRDVDHQLLDLEVLHRVGRGGLGVGLGHQTISRDGELKLNKLPLLRRVFPPSLVSSTLPSLLDPTRPHHRTRKHP